eukprot:Opistho-2@27303
MLSVDVLNIEKVTSQSVTRAPYAGELSLSPGSTDFNRRHRTGFQGSFNIMSQTYIPRHFEETDVAKMHGLIESHPFATWACVGEDGDIIVNHIPLMIDRQAGPLGTLVGHVAKANTVWKRATKSVFVFQGPDAYISPSMYPSKLESGKAVPTWNYVVVHAHGTPKFFHDRERLREI